MRFSPDGLCVVTGSWDDLAQFWDSATGLPISEPLRHASWVHSVDFSPQGDRLATVAFLSNAQVWEVPRFSLPVPAWLPELVEAVADQEQDASGNLKPVSADTLLQIKQTVEKLSDDDWCGRWASWFFADRESRPLSPSSAVAATELARRLTDQDSNGSMATAIELAPLDPTVLARRAWHLMNRCCSCTGRNSIVPSGRRDSRSPGRPRTARSGRCARMCWKPWVT
jgi:hypothetical protein